jgi:chromosome segregation ATPase
MEENKMKINKKIMLMTGAFLALPLFTMQAAEGSTPQASPSRFRGLSVRLLQEQVDEQATEIASLTALVHDLERKCDDAGCDKQSLENLVDALREQLDDLSLEHEKAEQKISEVTGTKNAHEKLTFTLRKENENMERQLSEVKAHLEDAGQKVAEQRTLLSSEKMKTEQLHDEVAHVTTYAHSLEVQLRESAGAVDKVTHLEEALLSQMTIIDSLQEQIHALQKQVKKHADYIEVLESSLQDQEDLLNSSQRAGLKQDSDEKLQALVAQHVSTLQDRNARITLQTRAIETQRGKIQALERLLGEHGIALPY